MSSSFLFRTACFLGFLAVALGAFGAHGFKDLLARNGTTSYWETAVFYQFIHVLVLLFLSRSTPLPQVAAGFFLAGILLFSGSLYLLAAMNFRVLGAVTPIGGAALLIGWAWLAWKGAS
jgi:uncharacterized membrane protein YgdD (TMEM256/DUF423 family)